MVTEAGPFRIEITEWSGRRGSNSRALPWQGNALKSVFERGRKWAQGDYLPPISTGVHADHMGSHIDPTALHVDRKKVELAVAATRPSSTGGPAPTTNSFWFGPAVGECSQLARSATASYLGHHPWVVSSSSAIAYLRLSDLLAE